MSIYGQRRGDTGVEDIEVDVREMIDLIVDPATRPYHDFDGFPQTRLWIGGGPHPALGDLLDDIAFPSIVARPRLQSVNLWLRHGPYKNPNHYDPNGADNLNVQVAGTKRWRLFGPDLAAVLTVQPAMTSIHPPFMSSYAAAPDESEARPGFAEAEGFEAVVGPGQAIFVPAFWMHWVDALAEEMTISVNYWWSPERVPMAAIPASWAFINALIDVFRRRAPGASLDDACAAIRDLSDETRAVLLAVEQALLDRPELVRSATAIALRR